MPPVALTLIKKALPVLAVFFLIWLYGQHKYQQGYDVRESAAVKAEAQALEIQRDIYQAQISDYRAKEQLAKEAADNATKASLAFKRKADSYYANWMEARKNVELTTPENGNTCPDFTIGFVGLFNLAVKGGTASGEVGVSDIADAASIGGRPAGADLSAAAGVTPDDVLTVTGHNSKIMRQCLSDRAGIKAYLENLHDNGFYR